MDIQFKERFLERWARYFPQADLPIVFYYTDDVSRAEPPPAPKGFRCVVCDLAKVRKGTSLRFDAKVLGCGGGKRYLGFVHELRPNFEFFLSCGIPGEMEGERYKKSPELVREFMKDQPVFEAPGKYIVFKRWDKLDATDDPLVAIFFASPDVLSGLFTLANFDETDPCAVVAPFCSGCAAIVGYPYGQFASQRPRAVLGMFDISARPCVPPGELTFAVPLPKFVQMVDNMEESFLITKSWKKVMSRIDRQGKGT